MNKANIGGSVMALVAAAAATPVALATPPSSHARGPVMSITVKYGDLDLGSDAGIQAVTERIQRAAKHACSAVSSTHIADYRQVYSDCYHFAVADAAARLRTVQLSASNGRRTPMGGD